MTSMNSLAQLTPGHTGAIADLASLPVPPSTLRNAILECAAGVARSDGLQAVDISSVAETVGISANHAFSHFSSTSILIDALWDEMIDGLDMRTPDDHFPHATLPSREPRTVAGYREPTIAEMMRDPLIALMNEADRIDVRQFAQLMESAARVLLRK